MIWQEKINQKSHLVRKETSLSRLSARVIHFFSGRTSGSDGRLARNRAVGLVFFVGLGRVEGWIRTAEEGRGRLSHSRLIPLEDRFRNDDEDDESPARGVYPCRPWSSLRPPKWKPFGSGFSRRRRERENESKRERERESLVSGSWLDCFECRDVSLDFTSARVFHYPPFRFINCIDLRKRRSSRARYTAVIRQ